VSDAIQIQASAFFFFASDWVEETNALDEATVACITAVSDNNLVERTLFSRRDVLNE